MGINCRDKEDTGAILGVEMIMIWVWPSSLEKGDTGVIWFCAYRQKSIYIYIFGFVLSNKEISLRNRRRKVNINKYIFPFL